MLSEDSLPTPRVPASGECSIPSAEFCDSLGLVKSGELYPICFVFQDFICPTADRPARFRAAVKFGRLAGGQESPIVSFSADVALQLGWLAPSFSECSDDDVEAVPLVQENALGSGGERSV